MNANQSQHDCSSFYISQVTGAKTGKINMPDKCTKNNDAIAHNVSTKITNRHSSVRPN